MKLKEQCKKCILPLLDGIIFVLSLVISYVLFTKLNVQLTASVFYSDLPVIIIFYYFYFILFGMYKSLWQYASVEELLRGGFANAAAFASSYVMIYIIPDISIPLPLAIFFGMLTFILTLGVRLSLRAIRVLNRNRNNTKTPSLRTLIIGAGQAGTMILHEIYNNPTFNANVIGFIDDDPQKQNRIISNIRVLGTTHELKEIIIDYNIEKVIIAIPSASHKFMTKILDLIDKTQVIIKVLPSLHDMIDTTVNLAKLRDIKIEDLLGRDVIELDQDGILEYITNKTILVTGGGGSIGSELSRQIIKFQPSKLIILDIYENNAYDLQQELNRTIQKYGLNIELIVLIASVRDQKRIEDIFNEYKPHIVFHAAAHKHVPLMEDSPQEAIKNNIYGTLNVVKAADQANVAKFVLISTDKAVNPTSVMGASKRVAELIIQRYNEQSKTEYAAVRFGNVLGSNGSVIPLFRKQIELGGPVTVTHKNIIRYFMTIPEACQLVLQAGAYAKGGEIFVLDMGEPVKIVTLAEKLIDLAGYRPYKDIDIKFIGLRPGEKMYEELLIDPKTTIQTDNKKIFIENKVSDNLEELKSLSKLLQYDIDIDILKS